MNASSSAATPLCLAVLKGRSNIAKLLISKYRAAVSTTDPEYGTPLHCAAFAGEAGVAKTMLEHGARVDSMCALDPKKLRWLSSCSLEKVGPKSPRQSAASAHPFTHATPLHVAVLQKHATMVDFLIQNGSAIDQPSDFSVNGSSTKALAACNYPIHVASYRGVSDIIALLVASKANVDVQDPFGHSALMHACMSTSGHSRIVRQLLEAGARTDLTDHSGDTALHVASRNGHADCVRELCGHHGVLIGVKNRRGQTPLQCAQERGHKECVRILRNYRH